MKEAVGAKINIESEMYDVKTKIAIIDQEVKNGFYSLEDALHWHDISKEEYLNSKKGKKSRTSTSKYHKLL